MPSLSCLVMGLPADLWMPHDGHALLASRLLANPIAPLSSPAQRQTRLRPVSAKGSRRSSGKRGRARQHAQAEVLYWPNFFSQEDHTKISEVCRQLTPGARPEINSLAKGRLGAYLPGDSPAAQMMLSKEACLRIGRKVGAALLPGDYPVELRVYPVGSYMDWHVDEVMYSEPQYEMIYTIDNTTDSETQWIAAGELVSYWAEPNSLIAVRAGGPEHQVTRIGKGKRTILKFILTPTLDKNEVFQQNLGRAAFK